MPNYHQPNCKICKTTMKLYNHRCRWHEEGKKTPITQRIIEQKRTKQHWHLINKLSQTQKLPL